MKIVRTIVLLLLAVAIVALTGCSNGGNDMGASSTDVQTPSAQITERPADDAGNGGMLATESPSAQTTTPADAPELP